MKYTLKTFIQDLEKNRVKLSDNIIVKGDFYNRNVDATLHGYMSDLCIYIPKHVQNDFIYNVKNHDTCYLYVGYAYKDDVSYLTVNDILQKLKEIKKYPNSKIVFIAEDEYIQYEISTHSYK